MPPWLLRGTAVPPDRFEDCPLDALSERDQIFGGIFEMIELEEDGLCLVDIVHRPTVAGLEEDAPVALLDAK
jgi:hypothetical protein